MRRRAPPLATLLLALTLLGLSPGCVEDGPGTVRLYVGNETPAPVRLVVLLDGVEVHNATLPASDSGGDFRLAWERAFEPRRATLKAVVEGGGEAGGDFALRDDTSLIVAVSESGPRIHAQTGRPQFM